MRESVSRGALPQSRTSARCRFSAGVRGAGPQAAALGSPTEKRGNAREERHGFGTGYGGTKVRSQ